MLSKIQIAHIKIFSTISLRLDIMLFCLMNINIILYFTYRDKIE